MQMRARWEGGGTKAGLRETVEEPEVRRVSKSVRAWVSVINQNDIWRSTED